MTYFVFSSVRKTDLIITNQIKRKLFHNIK